VAEDLEESWLISSPFVTSFLRVTGTRKSASAHLTVGKRLYVVPVLSHPDYDRRLRNCTESADPNLWGSALAGFAGV
jgi:hypothetical protein